jgi:hypothetical protein
MARLSTLLRLAGALAGTAALVIALVDTRLADARSAAGQPAVATSRASP